MVDATSEGAHMELSTYLHVLDFVQRFGPNELLLVSGGEPTEHPELIHFLELAKQRSINLIVLSNGTFVKENKPLLEQLLALEVKIQITNDVRYYPQRVEICRHPKFYYVDELTLLAPFGRAKNMTSSRQSPLCFNLRSSVRGLKNFERAIEFLRLRGKMCAPSINVDGTLMAGESPFCSSFGTILDTNETLLENLCNLTCGKCDLYKNLTPIHLNAIGEFGELERVFDSQGNLFGIS